jgi:UDP-glucose 4-epimerase
MQAATMGRLVVTGANGFIGRRLVTLALAGGWSVTALTRNVDWLQSLSDERLMVRQWDIQHTMQQMDVLEGADAVCHLAAFIPPDHTSALYAEQCYQANAYGTLTLLEATLKANVQQVVYFSAGNCYAPLDRLARESDALYPAHRATFYLVSKLVGEVYAEHYRLNHNLRVTSLRVSSPYGPSMNPQSLVPRFVERARRGLPIEVHDGGRYSVDLVYVDDVVSAALEAIQRRVDGILNIGSGTLSSTLDVARQAVTLVGATPDLIQVLPDTGQSAARGYSGLNITRARTVLGYTPTTLSDGMRQFLA